MAFRGFIALLLLLVTAAAAEPIVVKIDLSRTNGIVRPLHGVNKGPVAFGGLINLAKDYRAAGIPHIRLHDCQWPYPDVVDVHAIFRNPDADAKSPASYDFVLTDDYLKECVATGARIIYRLGESIEHAPTKRFVHPPRDANKWADVCESIIQHYNEGWADGFRYDIQYWEIWNEPENRPAMWTGTDEQYFELYKTASTRLKRAFPKLKFGGPALGHTGELVNNVFTPSPFLREFLARCRDENLPLDFFSWHCYTDDPHELVARAAGIRKLLNAHGLGKTEMHLNEWNYLPAKSWDGVTGKATPAMRAKFENEMTGPAAAAFVAASLIALQDADVTVANFFHGETGLFGLFDQYGGPTKIYRVFEAFNRLAGKPRTATTGGTTTYALATTDCAFIAATTTQSIRIEGLQPQTTCLNVLTGARERLQTGPLNLSGPGVWLIE